MTPSEWLLWRADQIRSLEAEKNRLYWAHREPHEDETYRRREAEVAQAIEHLQVAPYQVGGGHE